MLNVMNFGAIGDGRSHPLGSKFPTLEQARQVYPCATSLDDEIDWAAIQTAVNQGVAFFPLAPGAEKGGMVTQTDTTMGDTIYLPRGAYIINQTITISNIGTWLLGDGMVTTQIAMRWDAKPAIPYAVHFNSVYIGPPSGLRHLEIKSQPNANLQVFPVAAAVLVDQTNVVYLDHLWVNGMNNGVVTQLSGDNIYESCYCEANVGYGFVTTTSAPMRFINCSTFDNHTGGFRFENNDLNHPYTTLMSGCQSVGDASYGFYITGYNDLVLSGIVVSSVGAPPTAQSTGIYIENAQRVNISGANIQRPWSQGDGQQGYGINIVKDSAYINITNIAITCAQMGANPPANNAIGINADKSTAYVTVTGGSIQVDQGKAVQLDGKGCRVVNVTGVRDRDGFEPEQQEA